MALKIGLRPLFLGLAFVALSLIGLQSQSAAAIPQTTTIYVDRLDDILIGGAGDCTAAVHDCMLRGAVEKANAGGGSYDIRFVVTGTILLAGPITITAPLVHIIGNDREAVDIVAPTNGPALVMSGNYANLQYMTVSGSGSGVNQDGVRIIGGLDDYVTNANFYNLGGSGLNVTGGSNHIFQYNVVGTGTANGIVVPLCTLGNHQYGFVLSSGYNTLYGNQIGCNLLGGVAISGTQGANNSIKGNDIGVTDSTHQPLPNEGRGLAIFSGAHDNQIGDPVGDHFNIIAGNHGNGIEIYGAQTTANRVADNLIGLFTHSGLLTTLISNTLNGVYIYGAAHDNTIGGSMANNEQNYISGNNVVGVRIEGTGASNSTDTAFNTIKGNLIGLDVYGVAAPNWGGGIYILNGGYLNSIGSISTTERNVISGNGQDGVQIHNGTLNLVYGNYIGTDPTGQVARTNVGKGVWIEGSASANNSIGEILSGYVGNLISGNASDGVALSEGAHDNYVYANTIGANLGITHSLPNNGAGVYIAVGATNNQLGSATDSAARNIVVYHNIGVYLTGAATASNTVGYNDIMFNSYGVVADGGTNYNLISHSHISVNYNTGAWLHGGAHDNQISGAYISANSSAGVFITGTGTTNNVISNTSIIGNYSDGIQVGSDATGNWWTHVLSNQNLGLDVDIHADDAYSNVHTPTFPTITSVAVNGANVTINGTASARLIGFTTVKVELYAALPGVNGAGGLRYLGSTNSDTTGHWSINGTTDPVSFGSARCFVAFQTITSLLLGTNSSSEYGPNNCVTFLPALQRN